MIELSRLRGSERYAARSDEVTAHPPPGSPLYGSRRYSVVDRM